MAFLRAVLTIVAVFAVAILAMRLIFPLPEMEERAASSRLPATENTSLGSAILPLADERPGESGIWPLADGREAFAARVLLARAAEESIDIQYYIWQTDTTGWILLDEVRAAAERGVRVRLLLDDNGIPGLDAELAALNAMVNVEVRLFNPFTLRSPKLLSYAFDFPRLNRRMHNKSMTVDGIATVVGGRNIGDVYFSYGTGVHYFDADALAVGSAAKAVSGDFDLYWNSESAYPAELILPDAPGGLQSLQRQAMIARENAAGSGYVEAIRSTPLIERLEAGTLELEWGNVLLFSDDPAKGVGEAAPEDLLIGRITAISPPEESLDLVSAYFIPGDRGTALLTSLAEGGIRARVMTNSLAATDVLPVHAAYMGYRKALVEAGVDLLELRESAQTEEERSLSTMIVGSASSLHAKTFAMDGNRIFVGSFNFDPRSAQLNTEMGLLIPSERMARGLAAALDRPEPYYVVELDASDDLIWIATDESSAKTVYESEPETNAFQKAILWVVAVLPVEWML